MDTQAAPSAREIQSSVDAYLASARSDASLVGGCGSAGYDGGFWIRGGTFLMKINLTIQTRFEYFDWDDVDDEPSPGGDLSGFSLPRVTLKFSGDATCDVHYYAELEFGHGVSPNLLDNENVVPVNRSAGFLGENGRDELDSFLTDLARGVDRVRGGAATRVPHGPHQDGGHPPADDPARDAAVRGHLDGFRVQRGVHARFHGPQPRLRLHGPRRARLRRRVAVHGHGHERRRPGAPQRA